jgi:hypothetical protein
MRYASSRALLSGNITMAGDIVSGLSGAVSSFGGGGGGGGSYPSVVKALPIRWG